MNKMNTLKKGANNANIDTEREAKRITKRAAWERSVIFMYWRA